MPDVPPAAMARYQRLRQMRDLARATLSGANVTATEIRNHFERKWGSASSQLAPFGVAVLREDGSLVVEVHSYQHATTTPRPAQLPQVRATPGYEHLARELVEVRGEMREAEAQRDAAAAIWTPIACLVSDCEQLLRDRHGWVA